MIMVSYPTVAEDWRRRIATRYRCQVQTRTHQCAAHEVVEMQPLIEQYDGQDRADAGGADWNGLPDQYSASQNGSSRAVPVALNVVETAKNSGIWK